MPHKRELTPQEQEALRLFNDPNLGALWAGALAPGLQRQGIIDRPSSDPPTVGRNVRHRLTPILEARLGPALSQAVAQQAGRPGASIEGVLSGLATTGGMEIGRELAGLQSEIERARAGIPTGPSAATDALGGAAEGFAATGSGFGAAAGFVGGGLRNRGARRQRRRAERQLTQAEQEATPQSFFGNVAEAEGPAREEALASGAGQQSAQALEAAITASGLRGTGLGTLASIAAGGQVELAGLEAMFQQALGETQRTVERTLGAPIRARGDSVAAALEGLSNFLLTPREQRGPSGGPTEAPAIFSGQPDFTPADAPLFTPASGEGVF